jgi:transposase
MDAIYVGIDVSKDRLDVAVRRNGESLGGDSFVVSRDGAGIEDLIGRLKALAPRLIAVEVADGAGRAEMLDAQGLDAMAAHAAKPAQCRGMAVDHSDDAAVPRQDRRAQ